MLLLATPGWARFAPPPPLDQAVRQCTVIVVTLGEKREVPMSLRTSGGQPVIEARYTCSVLKIINGTTVSLGMVLDVSSYPENDTMPPTMRRPKFDVPAHSGYYVLFLVYGGNRWSIWEYSRPVTGLEDPYIRTVETALAKSRPGPATAPRPARDPINPLLLGQLMAQVNQKDAERKAAQEEARRRNPPSLNGWLSWQDGERDFFLALTVADGGRWDVDHSPAAQRESLMKLVGTTLTVQGRALNDLTCSHGPYRRFEVTHCSAAVPSSPAQAVGEHAWEGVVKWVELEGGFVALVTETATFDVSGPKANALKELIGKRVRVRGVLSERSVGIHMHGKILEVRSFEVIK